MLFWQDSWILGGLFGLRMEQEVSLALFSILSFLVTGGFLALFGISLAVFVLVALVAALVVSLRAQWARVTVRVAGSWIKAIGLLMLGWTYRGMG